MDCYADIAALYKTLQANGRQLQTIIRTNHGRDFLGKEGVSMLNTLLLYSQLSQRSINECMISVAKGDPEAKLAGEASDAILDTCREGEILPASIIEYMGSRSDDAAIIFSLRMSHNVRFFHQCQKLVRTCRRIFEARLDPADVTLKQLQRKEDNMTRVLETLFSFQGPLEFHKFHDTVFQKPGMMNYQQSCAILERMLAFIKDDPKPSAGQ